MQIHEEIYFMLPCGETVKLNLFNSILRDILDACNSNAFIPNELYSSEHLVSPEYWISTDKAGHILIGKCVAYMARTGKIPFDIQGCEHNHRYILKVM